ncbi:hypothetical protein GOBAR_DD06289 [Gossypium barbadense]|nr:hypothetical protein GOBAR_DD06289 [Gossypium barbadense]
MMLCCLNFGRGINVQLHRVFQVLEFHIKNQGFKINDNAFHLLRLKETQLVALPSKAAIGAFRYYRSTETIHRYFKVVLRAILKLYKLVIRSPDESTPSEIKNNPWEGSAHDSRILSDALSRPSGLRISEGKYYLVNAGYGIRNGYITPYHGVRYHLNEFSAQGIENAEELFNLQHLSLRLTVERVFGILKKWFHVLDAEPFWNFQTQVDIVLVCCIIHNHIMGVDPNDLLNQGLYEESESDLIIQTFTEREEREEAREWSTKRDEIAQTIWNDYMARNIRMGKGNKEGTSKQFRWTKQMEHVFLEILVEEAQKGNKPSNTFKVVSINRVVEAIFERFQVQCNVKHVENHLRIVKNQWQIICKIRGESGFGWDDNMKMITCDRATYDAAVMIICKIRGESGFGWDDNMKMITCDRATYDAAVMAHKKYEPFLNKSINRYDEMVSVVGKDMATGSFSRTFADIDLDDGNQDSVPINCDNEEIEEIRHYIFSKK